MKRTKIIATIGPKTESYEMLKKLGEKGVDIFRLNFSHGTHEWHKNVIKQINKLRKKTGIPYGIMLDTKGPEIRTCFVKKPIKLTKGKNITLTVEDVSYEESGKIKISYDKFIKDIKIGDRILLDNGFMTLKAKSKKGKDIICNIIDGGILNSRRHVNLPGKKISLDSITTKDWEDIKFGIKYKVDFFAVSFVRTRKEIDTIRNFLKKKKSNISIISKIETAEALENMDSIFDSSDGVMVARGDLGAETPFEHVPIRQWQIAQKGAIYKKPVIIATHMLESMIRNPMPTRAEVSDVFAAVWQRNDAVMLSGETAVGEHPIKAVEAMQKIALETEREYLSKNRLARKVEIKCEKGEFCHNAADAAKDLPDVKSIVVITKSGYMANLVASFRPSVPIYALTDDKLVRQKVQLFWGTKGYQIKFSRPETTIKRAIAKLVTEMPSLKGQKFVLLSDILINKKFVPGIQIRDFK